MLTPMAPRRPQSAQRAQRPHWRPQEPEPARVKSQQERTPPFDRSKTSGKSHVKSSHESKKGQLSPPQRARACGCGSPRFCRTRRENPGKATDDEQSHLRARVVSPSFTDALDRIAFAATTDGADEEDGAAEEIELGSTESRAVPVRVRVDPGNGEKGSNKIWFTLQVTDGDEAAIKEKAVFFIPR